MAKRKFVDMSTNASRSEGESRLDKLATSLVPGPTWNSFEQFRLRGPGALEEIPEGGVAMLRSKTGAFRVLHDTDFQALLGVASEVHRLKGGLKLIISAARIYSKFRDKEHQELLMEAVSVFAGSPVLPEREGHAEFAISPEEKLSAAEDEFELDEIRIPKPPLSNSGDAK